MEYTYFNAVQLLTTMKKYTALSTLIFAFFLTTACSGPGGKIKEDSKNDACKQNLVNALYTFSVDLGLPIQIAEEDAETIFNTGEVSKAYGLAGYSYTAYFGLENGDEGCSLKYFKQDKKGPGENTTSYANYGTVLLEDCECE